MQGKVFCEMLRAPLWETVVVNSEGDNDEEAGLVLALESVKVEMVDKDVGVGANSTPADPVNVVFGIP